ncbi:glycosyltransferase family 32 protein [Pectobacterium sp. CHL-2024]|uniref:glycosyltransferase family 32 protein n=1 Tax=Pectobacterium sp. CHL-2024 TaxID=3377079 RepID=UPI00380ED519
MIPRIFHYIWLGKKEMPVTAKRCMDSWMKYNPDFEIKLWNESNLNIKDDVYIKAYKKEAWAFCADYARLLILKEHGGVYLDIDMELIKPFSNFLELKCFLGKETDDSLSCGVIGCEKNDDFISECFYELRESMKKDFVPIPRIFNYVYEKNEFSYISVFEKEYFYPYNPFSSDIKILFYSDIKECTHAIHHWNYSWKPTLKNRVLNKLKRSVTRSKFF